MNRLAAILFIILAVCLASASAQTKTVEEIVAWANNEIILKSELDRALKELKDGLAQEGALQGARLDQEYETRSKDVLRDLIDQSLLLQVAAEQGLSADIEVIKAMERLRQEYKFESMEALERAIVQQGGDVEDFKKNIRTRYLTSQVIGREIRIVVTTEELRNYYETHKADFDRPAGIQLQEITIFTANKTPAEIATQRQKAEEALTAIKNGEDFAEVALRLSESDTAAQGAELGFFQAGELAADLESSVANLERGQNTEILTRPDSFMILKVADKHSGGLLSFELAQNEISNRLYSERQGPKIREYLTRLRTIGYVKVAPGYVDSGAVVSKTSSNQ